MKVLTYDYKIMILVFQKDDVNELVFRNDDESLFSAETTPLILAAQRNRYEIVSYLTIQKGNRHFKRSLQ